jgi:predicted GNAT family N-acyltransferase
MKVVIGNSPELISQVQSIRYQVFVVEQSIPLALDLDGLDDTSVHALVMKDNVLVATARLSKGFDGHAVMARVAVMKAYRGSGVATKVIDALMAHARFMGLSSIEIHAHEYLRNYYERFGFEFIRDVEVVGGHPLIEMRHQLATPSSNN